MIKFIVLLHSCSRGRLLFGESDVIQNIPHNTLIELKANVNTECAKRQFLFLYIILFFFKVYNFKAVNVF